MQKPLHFEPFLKGDSLILKLLKRYALKSFHYVPYFNSFVVVDFSMILWYIDIRNKIPGAGFEPAGGKYQKRVVIVHVYQFHHPGYCLVLIGKPAPAANLVQFSLFFFVMAL